jgi:hypothetical protein
MRLARSFDFEKLMTRFLSTEAGKSLVAEEQEAVAADRTRAVRRLAELERIGAEHYSQFESQHGEADAKFRVARIHLETCAAELTSIAQNRSATNWRLSTERDDIERMLESTCPPEVTELVDEIRDAIERVRSSDVSCVPLGIRSTQGAPVRVYATNAPTTHSFLEEAVELLAKAKTLALSADEKPVLAKTIEAIRARLLLAYNGIVIEQIEVARPIFVRENAR